MDPLKIGVIGGSGLGSLLEGQGGQRHEIDTPFGKPSDAITEVQWEGLSVLLLSRHGAGHLLNPSAVPYRANIFALKQLGCTHIIASGAVGSLRDEFRPRDLVIPDQIIDKATFEHPHQYSQGIRLVIVNGYPVLRDDKMTGVLSGRPILGPGAKQPSQPSTAEAQRSDR